MISGGRPLPSSSPLRKLLPPHLLPQLRQAGEDRGVLRSAGHDVRDKTASPAAAAATITTAAAVSAAVTTVAAKVEAALPGRHDRTDDGPWSGITQGEG